MLPDRATDIVLHAGRLSLLPASVQLVVEGSYAEFIRTSLLSIVEGARLVDALTGYQLKIIQHAKETHFALESDAMQAFRQSMKEQLDVTLRDLLGARRFALFENYRMGLLG